MRGQMISIQAFPSQRHSLLKLLMKKKGVQPLQLYSVITIAAAAYDYFSK
jgi:hypothetical protein